MTVTDEHLRRIYLITQLISGVLAIGLSLYLLTPQHMKDDFKVRVRRVIVPYRRHRQRQSELAHLRWELFQIEGILDDYDSHRDPAQLARDLGHVEA